jgi:hypothetical protein
VRLGRGTDITQSYRLTFVIYTSESGIYLYCITKMNNCK